MFVTIGLVYLLLPQLLKLYGLTDVTAQVTKDIIVFHSINAILIWPLSFTLASSFRACGDARTCMVISIASMWIFRIGCSYLLGQFLDMGVFGIWVAMIVDWAFRSICFVVRYFSGKWKKHALV